MNYWRVCCIDPRILCNVLLSCVLLLVQSQSARAGGFPVDSHHCPPHGWFPSNDFPAGVTGVVCQFLQAVDERNYGAAYRFLAPSLQQRIHVTELSHSYEKLRTTEGDKPERALIDENAESGTNGRVYQFLFRVTYNVVQIREEIFVSQDSTGQAAIVGAWLRPD